VDFGIARGARQGRPTPQSRTIRALAAAEQQALAEAQPAAAEALERTMRQVRDLAEAAQERLAQLDQVVAQAAIGPLFDRLPPTTKTGPM